MTSNVRNDTPTPAAGQRPADLRSAIDVLCRYPAFAPLRGNAPSNPTSVGYIIDFVIDLIETYPELVMAEVVTRRNKELADALGSYRGEV